MEPGGTAVAQWVAIYVGGIDTAENVGQGTRLSDLSRATLPIPTCACLFSKKKFALALAGKKEAAAYAAGAHLPTLGKDGV